MFEALFRFFFEHSPAMFAQGEIRWTTWTGAFVAIAVTAVAMGTALVLARAALLDPANASVADVPAKSADETQPGPIAQLGEQTRAPMSKRDFLRGRFLRGESLE